MSIQVKNEVDFNGNKAKNIGLERLSSAPQNPKVGQIYVDSNDNLIKQYDGTTWVSLGFSGGMVYKGTVGTGGTVTTLPTTNVESGDTYMVCADGTYASQVAVIGDLFVAVVDKTQTPAALSWSYIPSGNDKFIGTITGDSTTTSFTIVHTLNSQNVNVTIYDDSTGGTIITDVIRTNNTTITITFGSAPATGEVYKVVILG